MAKTPEDGGAKADDRGQGMTRLIAAPRPTRFDLKNGSRRTETSTLDSRGQGTIRNYDQVLQGLIA